MAGSDRIERHGPSEREDRCASRNDPRGRRAQRPPCGASAPSERGDRRGRRCGAIDLSERVDPRGRPYAAATGPSERGDRRGRPYAVATGPSERVDRRGRRCGAIDLSERVDPRGRPYAAATGPSERVDPRGRPYAAATGPSERVDPRGRPYAATGPSERVDRRGRRCGAIDLSERVDPRGPRCAATGPSGPRGHTMARKCATRSLAHSKRHRARGTEIRAKSTVRLQSEGAPHRRRATTPVVRLHAVGQLEVLRRRAVGTPKTAPRVSRERAARAKRLSQ